MAIFTWKDSPVPNNMEISQVYGIIFTIDGRILLRVEEDKDYKKYSLAGGRPEPYDKDIEDTCRREILEEINTTIEKPVYIGYQLVDDEDGSPVYAQVRMAAIINKVGPVRPDTDNGKVYKRFLTTPDRAIELLKWGEVGEKQIISAVKVLQKNCGLTLKSTVEEWA